jgi:hypothetical protein
MWGTPGNKDIRGFVRSDRITSVQSGACANALVLCRHTSPPRLGPTGEGKDHLKIILGTKRCAMPRCNSASHTPSPPAHRETVVLESYDEVKQKFVEPRPPRPALLSC